MEKNYGAHMLLLLCFSCCCFLCCRGSNFTDMEILLYFKSQFISSDPQNELVGWNNRFPVCNWPHITCTSDRTGVRDVSLHGLGLFGIIPPHLSNLSSLQTLDLADNFFHGPIPSQLGRLPLLQRLLLYNNSLDGTIPSNLSHCLSLLVINFTNNQLSGNIPSSLSFLTQLQILRVSVNHFVGPIPASIGNLTSLIDLRLARNELSGDIPKELGRLRNLNNLQISQNQLSGVIPSSIYNISSLKLFSVTQNKLTGELPEDIGLQLPNLKELYMSTNKFHGPIPSSLSNISRIKFLDLSANNFSGSIPSLGSMHDLIFLSLADNALTSTTDIIGRFFDSLTNCTYLKEFSVTTNQLAGQLPTSTGNLSAHLEDFSVDDNLFSGSFPHGVHSYRNLKILDLQQNSFTGSVPESIGILRKLLKFHLQENSFVGEIPDIFSNLTQLYQLNLSDNQFYGRIPQSIGDCQHLERLDVSGNNLTGNIPKELFNIRYLTFNLSLARNFLNGPLPIEVGKLNMLEFMDVSENELSGTVPVSIGDCSSLQGLNMARNRFEGLIPESFGQVGALESLDLSFNNLSGQIPMVLEKLRFLQNLNLSFNNLQAKVPVQGVFRNISWESLQGNKGLCSDSKDTQKKLRLPACSKHGSSSLKLKIILPIASSAVLLCVLFCLISSANSRKHESDIRKSSWGASFKSRHWKISYQDILSATNNFHSGNLIGEGGFSSVYKGIIGGENEITTTVAIKVFDLKNSKASKSFALECKTLRNIRHRNLVKIITCCSSIDHNGTEFKALVMDFMSNGSLEEWLHPEESATTMRLNLLQRLNISIDVAAAMDYLHHDCDPPVAHCDLKPSNVLLDDKMTASVGDFGLARLLFPSENRSSTVELKGSIGYIAPEYGIGSKASTSGDVYSYGILLLEIFTGKKPMDDMSKDGLNLNKFATAVFENRVVEIVDLSLLENDDDSVESNSTSSNTNTNRNDRITGGSHGNTENETEVKWQSRKEVCLEALIRIGLSCAAYSPKDRPRMREILIKMHDIKESLFQFGGK